MSMYSGLITEDDIDYADDFATAVWADLKCEATPEQQEMLHDNPLGWFRHLRNIKRQMNHSIAESRTHVRANYGDALAEKRARSEQYARRASRFHIIGKAEERRQYVIRIIGDEALTMRCIGEIIDDIARALEALEDVGLDEARKTLSDLAQALMRTVVFQNSEAKS